MKGKVMQVKPYKMVAFMLVAFGCWTLCAKTVDAVAFGAKPEKGR